METTDEICLRLASSFLTSIGDPKIRPEEEFEDFGSGYVYFINKQRLKIYFIKHRNRKVIHNFSVPYPWFTGQIIDNGNHRLIKGTIGQSEWTYYLTLLWFAFFAFISYMAWVKGGPGWQSNIPLYFILFGLISTLVGLIRTRQKVDEMRNEMDRVFSNAR